MPIFRIFSAAVLGAVVFGTVLFQYSPAAHAAGNYRPSATAPAVVPIEDEPDFELLDKAPDAQNPGGAEPGDKAPSGEGRDDPPGFGGCIFKPRTLELIV